MVTMSQQLVDRFSTFIAENLGLMFTKDRRPDLECRLEDIAKSRGFEGNVDACLESLLSQPLNQETLQNLARSLTIGETYFFRDTTTFELLEKSILPKLISQGQNNGRQLRVWSAGCCSGEELFSVAILLDRLLPANEGWSLSLMGSDINPEFLEKAMRGRYTDWSLRNTSESIKQRYFTKIDDKTYEIIPRIRQMVRFAYINLVDDTFPSLVNNTNAIDMLLCCNVLMYFNPEKHQKAVNKLTCCLRPEGVFITSVVEAGLLAASNPMLTCGEYPAFLWRTQPTSVVKAPETLRKAVRPQLSAPPPPKPTTLKAAPPCREEWPRQYAQGAYIDLVWSLEPFVNAHPFAKCREEMSMLIRSYANLGEWDKALSWCEEAAKADPLCAWIYHLQGTILLEKGQREEAKKPLIQALYLDDTSVLANYALASIYLREGRLTQAKTYLYNSMRHLQRYKEKEILQDSDGMTAHALVQLIQMDLMACKEGVAS